MGSVRNRLATLAGRRAAGPLARRPDLLPAGPHRTVAVLADAGHLRAVRAWLAGFDEDDVHLLWAGAPPHPRRARLPSRVVQHAVPDPLQAGDVLARLGPVDVIVDLLDAGAADADGAGAAERRWQQLFLHLRRGGAYVLVGDGAVKAAGWLGGRREPGARGEPGEQQPSSEAELAAAIGRITESGEGVVVRKRHHHLLKLREAALPEVLPRREPQLRYTDLETIPAGSYGSPAETLHHGPLSPTEWIGARIDYPAMRLRHYTGRLDFAGRMLVFGADTILPDAFSWPLSPDAENPFAVGAGPEFARIPARHLPKRELAGDYYLLDPNYYAFGHVMTEVVGRLWGWDRAKAELPDLKALFWVPDAGKVTGNEPKFRIPRAYGIPAEDIVWTDEPVHLESLVAPSPMWHNRQPYYAHPGLRVVWERLGDSLIEDGTPTHDRIFIGRTPEYRRRTCRNDQQVQQFFADRGFTVVYPELLDLGEQAALFAGAKVIAGYGGSGLFNVLFARNLQTLIVLNHHSYTARNEQLYATLLGADVHYFWSQADISHPPGGRSMAAVESEWEFDFAHNGPELEALLDGGVR